MQQRNSHQRNGCVQIIAVLKVLWDVSPALVMFVVCYSVLGTLITVTGFGKPLMRLMNEMLHREAGPPESQRPQMPPSQRRRASR